VYLGAGYTDRFMLAAGMRATVVTRLATEDQVSLNPVLGGIHRHTQQVSRWWQTGHRSTPRRPWQVCELPVYMAPHFGQELIV